MFENEPSEKQGESLHIDEDENKLAANVESNISILFFSLNIPACIMNSILLIL